MSDTATRRRAFADYYSAYVFDELTRKCYASAQFTEITARWQWVQEVVAANELCSPNDVRCIETDDGDKITVNGHVVAFLES